MSNCEAIEIVRSAICSLFNLEGIPQEVKIGRGGLAQLGERLPCKQEVAGSIPTISTKKNKGP